MSTPTWTLPHFMKTALENMDRQRRRQGDALEAAGYGPQESPFDVVHAEPGISLRRYAASAAERPDGPDVPAVLIVPAPIKRPYIWDLAPEISVVQRFLQQGMPVFLVDWARPEPADSARDLADYADRLLKQCCDAVEKASGRHRVVLAGHSLGGLMAAIFACLYPDRAHALILVESPLHFGPAAGSFAPWVAAAPDAYGIGDAFGNVPGSFLNLVSVAAAPQAFQWERHLDRQLAAGDAHASRNHLRVERWSCDESPLPGRLFGDIVEKLYRSDTFMRGELDIHGRRIGPGCLTCPLLNVVDARSSVVPAGSIMPFHEAAASREKRLLTYPGDIGVGLQHVGVLVGRQGHARIWPEVLEWLESLDAGRNPVP